MPLSALATTMGRDAIQLADFIQSLDQDLAVCIGHDAERVAASQLIETRRAAGAVLDTYTAWAAATTGAFDILTAVFGTLIVAQSKIDEIRSIAEDDKQLGKGISMTIAWIKGEFVPQVMTAADRSKRHTFILEQLESIHASCQVLPAAAPDNPTELAIALTENFGTYILDPANLALQGYVLLSEDLYYRQFVQEAVGVDGTWLQPVFAFARETGIVDNARYSDLAVKLAWRRHAHVSIDLTVLMSAFDNDTSPALVNFRALTKFIGIKDAAIMAHVTVASVFLGLIWESGTTVSLKAMAATSILLEQLLRHRQRDWHLALAYVSERGGSVLKDYINDWVKGHLLPQSELSRGRNQYHYVRSRQWMATYRRRLR